MWFLPAKYVNKSNKIDDYYGSKIALYFAWCSFYANWLILPALLGRQSSVNASMARHITLSPGAYVFVDHLLLGKASHLAIIFAVFLSLWSTCFIEFWKRRNAGISFESFFFRFRF